MLWQADLKYGPYQPDPNNPQKKRHTYPIVFMDDCTRLVPHAYKIIILIIEYVY